MAEADVIANQKQILKNQATVLANQKRIEGNQGKIQKNQEKILAEKRAFVERFRAKATKARQAQSRAKQIEKIEIEVLAPSSRVSEGMATFRTVLSSTTVSTARHRTPRISQRCGWPPRGGWGCGGAAWGCSGEDVDMLYTVERFLYGV